MEQIMNQPQNNTRVVYLVAVAEYKLGGFQKIDAIHNDLLYVDKALKDPRVGRCNSVVVRNKEYSGDDLAKDLFDEVGKLSSKDFFLFYFNGYADISPLDGNLHLFLGKTERKFIDSLSFETICRIIGTSKARDTLIILDCCYPDNVATSSLKGTELEKAASKLANDNRIAVIASTDSTRASKINQITNRSYFSEIFVDGITSGKADLNNDKIIDHNELAIYIQNKLKAINPILHLWYTPQNRSPIDVAYVSDSDSELKHINKRKEDFEDPPIGKILSRWDVPLVWDGVRNARNSVKVLQTWFPGVEAEVARYGFARNDLNYRMLLIKPSSEFVELRIRRRNDFSFLFGGHQEKTTKANDKVRSSIRWLSKMGYGSFTQLFDNYVPGPIYIIDDNVYYGIFLPQIDAQLTALHIVPINSEVGWHLSQFFDFVWSKSSPIEKQQTGELVDIQNTQLIARIEQLEHEVSWLMYPGNNPDAPKLQLVESGQIWSNWNTTALLSRISNARRRVYIVASWIIEPKEFFSQFGRIGGRDFRILLPSKNSQFSLYRSRIIARNSDEALTTHVEKLMTATVYEANKVPGLEVKYYHDFWHPGPIFIVDDTVFYGIYLRNENPFREPMHVVSIDSNPGRTITEAFDLGWRNSIDDYI